MTTLARALAALVLTGLFSAAPSARAEPTKAACVQANEAAQDLRRAGKLRAARDELVACLSPACPGPVRADCATRLDEVDRAMPTLVLEARDAQGHELTAVRVAVDAQPFAERLSGASMSIDPGEHVVTFEAPGCAPVSRTLVVHEGERERHERVVLASSLSPVAPGPSVPATRAPSEGASPTRPSPEPGTSGDSQRLVGVVLGGAGAVTLGVGGVLGIVAKSTYDRALGSECAGGDPSRCSPAGRSDGASAHGQAAVATGLFLAGGALLASGAVVYLLAPRAAVTAVVGSREVGLVWRGAF